MTLGEKIKLIRKETGLSQKDLAGLLSINQSVVSDYEADKYEPNYSKLKLIAEIAKKYKVKVSLL